MAVVGQVVLDRTPRLRSFQGLAGIVLYLKLEPGLGIDCVKLKSSIAVMQGDDRKKSLVVKDLRWNSPALCRSTEQSNIQSTKKSAAM